MIDLYHGELINMEPTSLASGIEEQCVSYALKQVTQLIIDKAKTTRTQAVIDELPEPVLDLLASELRMPYYLDSMDIETKRSIIEHAVPWHFQAGTPGVVKEFLSNVVGTGCELEEWFEYDGVPGRFRVCVDVSGSSEDDPVQETDVDSLAEKALRMKRFSAWLESFSYMIKNGIAISKTVEKWQYKVPECGTIYCGQYWTPATLGYTENDGVEIGAVVDPYAYTPPFCGTRPNPSTLGFTLQSSENINSDPNGFVYSSSYCGLRYCGQQ